MKLDTLLEQRKSSIRKKWFDRIVECYPADGAGFFSKEKDRFANPIGYTLDEETGTLMDGLIEGRDVESLSESLERIIKIKAVQEFTPSEAVEFVFFLKQIVRDELADDLTEPERLHELLEFESRIDRLALLAFGLFMKCREKIYELKSNQIRNRSYKLLERANLLTVQPEEACHTCADPEPPCQNGGHEK